MKNVSTKGFTLLLAILITNIILGISIGFPIFVIRELTISAIGRESQKAFFASDSGIECVLFWDFKHQGLAKSAFATTSTSNISCAGASYTVGGSSGISDFDLNFANSACSHVKVDKTNYPNTKIDSVGHNTCDLTDPNRVERSLQVSY
jgi:hypothetical protein